LEGQGSDNQEAGNSDSSPLKIITTELEKKNWLKTKARGRFVLVKDDSDEIAGVRIDLRKKICQQYLGKGSCPRTQGKCKFWHICKSFIEGNCDWKCSRSHDFFDPHNKGKTSEMGILQDRKCRRGPGSNNDALN